MSASQSPTQQRAYPSLSSFYLADPRRVASREKDMGLWWRDGAEGPLHRAAWVTDTQELYLVRLGPPEEGGGHVEVLAVAPRADLERAMKGWRQECGAPNSLAWLRERAARAGRRMRDARVRVVAAAGVSAWLSAQALGTNLA